MQFNNLELVKLATFFAGPDNIAGALFADLELEQFHEL